MTNDLKKMKAIVAYKVIEYFTFDNQSQPKR